MDRDDARFCADALASRIAGDREEIERLAASSLMRLSTIATRVRKLAGNWPPALYAAAELMDICRRGGAICDRPSDPRLQVFVDKMLELAAEPPRQVSAEPRNRAERRARISVVSRDRRIIIPPSMVN